MKKQNEEDQAIIEELKSRILGVMNAQNIYYDNWKSAEKRIECLEQLRNEIENTLKALKKNFRGYRVDKLTPAAKPLFEAIKADNENSKKEIEQFSKLYPKKSLKGGKPKIPREVCIVLLDAFDTCERNVIDLEWIRKLLAPSGEFRKLEQKIIVNPLPSLPIIPSAIDDTKWMHRQKETLLRSLLSGKDAVKKAKDHQFKAKEIEFYELIRSKKWQKNWLSCLSDVDRIITAVEKKKLE